MSNTMAQPINLFIDSVKCNIWCFFMSCKECRILKITVKNMRYCVVPYTEKYYNLSVLSHTFHDVVQQMASRENQFVRQKVFRMFVW